MKSKIKGTLLLCLTAFIWGTAFVSQTLGTAYVSPFTFSATRMLLGALVLLPVIIVRDFVGRNKEKKNVIGLTLEQLEKANKIKDEKKHKTVKKTLISGLIVGIAFCVAANLQQYAFLYSSPGKIAFITSTYVLFVPFISLIFGKKIRAITWISVVLGACGLFLLCVDVSDLSGGINFGDVLALVCAVAFAIHILVIEKFLPGVDGLKLSCLQFFVAGVISLVLMFIFEKPSFSQIKGAWLYIAYAGVLSCGVAYTLQIVGQKYLDASFATLIMSTESVFAVIASAIILPDTQLSLEEIIGCCVMFIAVVLPCVADIVKAKRESKNTDGID